MKRASTMLHAGRRCDCRWVNALLALVLALCLTGAHAADGKHTVAQVTHLSGGLVAKHADGTVNYLSIGSGAIEGDVLATQEGAYARLKFVDGAELVLTPSSRLNVVSYAFAENAPGRDRVELRLLKGGIREVTGVIARRSSDRAKLLVSGTAIGMSNAHFGVLLCRGDCDAIRMPGNVPPKDGMYIDVAAGAVTLTNAAGTQRVKAGQFVYASAGTPPLIVPARQGIQVTMPLAIARNATPAASGPQSETGCPTQ